MTLDKSKNKIDDELTVAEWLQSINLSHLASIFDAEDITFDIIPIMDETDLEGLGIHPSDIKVLLKHHDVLAHGTVLESGLWACRQ